MWIQILLLAGLILVAAYQLRSSPGANHQAIRRVAVILAAVAGIIVVIWPGLLSAIADVLGIGRGADLVLYGLVIVVLMEAVTNYKRSVRQARTTSALARELALTEARLEDVIKSSHESTK